MQQRKAKEIVGRFKFFWEPIPNINLPYNVDKIVFSKSAEVVYFYKKKIMVFIRAIYK